MSAGTFQPIRPWDIEEIRKGLLPGVYVQEAATLTAKAGAPAIINSAGQLAEVGTSWTQAAFILQDDGSNAAAAGTLIQAWRIVPEQIWEITLNEAWAINLIGTNVGMVKDSTLKYWYGSTADGGGQMRIVGAPATTAIGDTKSRVLAVVNPANIQFFSTSGISGGTPSANALTAHAGGTQAAALALTALVNRVTTVATAADSVKLPPAIGGLTVTVVNSGANPMQVFGSGTDTINDVATATGIAQPVGSTYTFYCPLGGTAGKWYVLPGFGYSAGLPTESTTNTITAFSTGGQTSAVALTTLINRISTVAALGDSVRLPASAAGLQILVDNRGANPCQVFGAGTDTINGIATATGISQGINSIVLYTCFVAGNWETTQGGAVQNALFTVAGDLTVNAHTPSSYVLNKGSAAAITLGAPTTGTDDGVEIWFTSNTAQAHVITATGLLQCGTASVNLATFAAQKGAGVCLVAFGAKWIVRYSVGITFS